MLHHASETSVPPAAMPVSGLDSDEGAAMEEEAEIEQVIVLLYQCKTSKAYEVLRGRATRGGGERAGAGDS